jgi:RNA polymerase sigma-70 factor, ECF subfamily
MSAPNDPTQGLVLHQRLLKGDRTASEELVSLILFPLVQEVSRKFPRVDDHCIHDGVTDAVLDYCARPHQFDENRGVPLDRFLSIAAWRNVANTLRQEKRRKVREEKAEESSVAGLVELDPVVGNLLQKEEAVWQQQQREAVMNVLHNPIDQEIWTLRLQGERRTEAFAEVLGIQHLPLAAQRREVKRAKDRIDKLLRRHVGDQS